MCLYHHVECCIAEKLLLAIAYFALLCRSLLKRNRMALKLCCLAIMLPLSAVPSGMHQLYCGQAKLKSNDAIH